MVQVGKYQQTQNRTTVNLITGVDHIDLSNISTFINQPPSGEVMEVLCPHLQLRDCIGQLALDVNARSGRPVFNVVLAHTKRFADAKVIESWLVVLEVLAAKPNRKQRRNKKGK